MINTILEIQPRVTGGGGSGKSSDEIIQELVENLEKEVPHVLDMQDHVKDLFKKTDGLMTCMATVLMQEAERFNKLLTKMKSSLKNLDLAIRGLVLMSQELDDMYSAFLKQKVPPNWEEVSYLSLKPLGSWVADLIERVTFMRNWLQQGHPKCYWLSGFFFPHGFMTGALQTFAREHGEPIDLVSFSFSILPTTEASSIDVPPTDGIYINGLFIEGAKWSKENEILEDQSYGEMYTMMPIIHFLPKANHEPNPDDYKCPVYKTSQRAGVLSTTGQSTNYILTVELPTVEQTTYWTLRSTALLTMLND